MSNAMAEVSHDADALMSFMSDDCVFEASAGPDVCGTRYAGREAVRAAFAEVWATFPDAHWGDARLLAHECSRPCRQRDKGHRPPTHR